VGSKRLGYIVETKWNYPDDAILAQEPSKRIQNTKMGVDHLRFSNSKILTQMDSRHKRIRIRPNWRTWNVPLFSISVEILLAKTTFDNNF